MIIIDRKRKTKESIVHRSIVVRALELWPSQACYLLKMNFSVGESMYRENVTSYW